MQMRLDRCDVVLVAAIGRDVGPSAGRFVAPREPGEERDLGRRISESEGVVEKKIVQLVGADGRLGILRGISVAGGNQLGTYGRRDDIEQRGASLAAETLGL